MPRAIHDADTAWCSAWEFVSSTLVYVGLHRNFQYNFSFHDQASRKGTAGMPFFGQRQGLISPWILFTLERVFRSTEGTSWITKSNDFSKETAIALELKILLNSPQANWSLLLKLLLMRNATVSTIIFRHLIKYLPSRDKFKAASDLAFLRQPRDRSKCDGFLCGKECDNEDDAKGMDDGQFDTIGFILLHIVT